VAFSSSLVIFRYPILASLFYSQLAYAQNSKIAESGVVDQRIGESLPEEAATVEKQSKCEIVLKNASSLSENQELSLSKYGSTQGTAIVRKLNTDSTAKAALDEKFCYEDFVGATVDALQTNKERRITKETTPSVQKLPSGVKWGSSAHERIRNKIIMRAGVGLMFGPGSTLAVGYNLSHRLTIEGTYDFAEMFVDRKAMRRRFGVLGNLFFGNSFYINSGMIYEIFSNSNEKVGCLTAVSNKVPPTDEPLLPCNFYKFSSEDRQLQLQLGIGDRWSKGRFVIGAEWVGLSAPLLKLSEKYNRPTGSDDSYFESYKSSNRELTNLYSFRLLNVYVGLSF